MTVSKNTPVRECFSELALARLNFVASEALLGLGVGRVCASDWVILLKNDLLSRVLGVLSSVVRTVAS